MTAPQKKPAEKPDADDQHKEADEENNYGGRDSRPDADVNPAEDMHVYEDEEGGPAKTDRHNAQQRKDKTKD